MGCAGENAIEDCRMEIRVASGCDTHHTVRGARRAGRAPAVAPRSGRRALALGRPRPAVGVVAAAGWRRRGCHGHRRWRRRGRWCTGGRRVGRHSRRRRGRRRRRRASGRAGRRVGRCRTDDAGDHRAVVIAIEQSPVGKPLNVVAAGEQRRKPRVRGDTGVDDGHGHPRAGRVLPRLRPR